MAEGAPSADLQSGAPPPSIAPLLLAVFVRALPLTMIGPLLSTIGSSLGASLADMGWVVATYAMGSLLAQPIMGRLSDVRGRRRTMLWCIGLFGVGSLFCANATSFAMLVAGRTVQALGAGGIQPVATAMIGDRLREDRRPQAIGSLYAMFGLGTMAGALAGGALVEAARWTAKAGGLPPAVASELARFPWHAPFWLNVVLAACAFAAMMRWGPDAAGRPASRARFDVLGALLVVAATAALMTAVTTDTAKALGGLAASLAAVAALIVWERRARAPLFDPAVLGRRDIGAIYAIAALFGIPSFSLTIYSATYFIARFGAGEAQSGEALFVLAVLYVIGAIAGGRAGSGVRARTTLAAGLAIAIPALLFLASAPSKAAAVIAMGLGGLGLGLVSAPPNALILERVGEHRSGSATGVATMLATSGSITAPAFVSAFLHFGGVVTVTALQRELEACAAICAMCVALTALIRPSTAQGGPQGFAAPAAETDAS